MKKLVFSGQRPNEEILFVFRRHIIAMRKGFYGLLIPMAIGSIPFLIWSTNVDLLWGPIIGLGVGAGICFYHWVGWYFSVYIVTNKRIRQVVQKGLFGKSVIDINLNKILNHSYKVPGLFGEIFHFGTIVLQTMVGDLVIKNVEHCEKVYGELVNAIDAAGGGRGEEDDEEVQNGRIEK
ncbi:MAG: PH domain-containing protein [Candidatus Nomurabacteria bacterium]|jgi:hypothetical protein|nr:PH domain-containing protein [Candidatus Nomurabacteria bacterium]